MEVQLSLVAVLLLQISLHRPEKFHVISIRNTDRKNKSTSIANGNMDDKQERSYCTDEAAGCPCPPSSLALKQLPMKSFRLVCDRSVTACVWPGRTGSTRIGRTVPTVTVRPRENHVERYRPCLEGVVPVCDSGTGLGL